MEEVNCYRQTHFGLLYFVWIETETVDTGKMDNWNRSHNLHQ